MTYETLGTILLSTLVGSLTFFIAYINWKIFKVSQALLKISVELLAETIIIREETVLIRHISEDIYIESVRLRKALGDPVEYSSKEE
tara:strand:+ start:543 stop:803 length:261 start_codon:yes stop_codon:yes gene_type:complete